MEFSEAFTLKRRFISRQKRRTLADEQFPAAVTALEEYHNIEQQMAEPEVASDPDKMRKLGRRHAELGVIVSAYTAYKQVKDDLEAAKEMASEDPDFAEEAKRLESELPAVEEKLRTALIPRDPDDARDTIMEIKAGTGGEEAALFAGDLLRMYMRYAEKRGWTVTLQSENTTELGGVKDVQLAIRAKGTPAPEDGVWASLKYEGGVHRVQRIPVTESQGRIQTSAAGVIVFPEADEDDDEIEIDQKDLKIDIFMSSGPGGQSEVAESFLHQGFAVGQFVNASHEIEIFAKGEVFPEGKFLRHVPDPPFDAGAFPQDVKPQASAAARIRREQAAHQADARCLSAPVRAEKTVYFPTLHTKRNIVNDLFRSETLAQVPHVDGRRYVSGCHGRLTLIGWPGCSAAAISGSGFASTIKLSLERVSLL